MYKCTLSNLGQRPNLTPSFSEPSPEDKSNAGPSYVSQQLLMSQRMSMNGMYTVNFPADTMSLFAGSADGEYLRPVSCDPDLDLCLGSTKVPDDHYCPYT